MKRAVVVFESMFGNTRSVAEAIADGLRSHAHVDVVEVGSASSEIGDTDILVVGGPTHAFGMTRVRTRDDAKSRSQADVVSRGVGIREWLEGLERPVRTVEAMTFDTRINRPRVPGSAARAASRRLQKRGFHVVAQPQTFWVEGVEGPLCAGELDRARSWGERLGLELAAAG